MLSFHCSSQRRTQCLPQVYHRIKLWLFKRFWSTEMAVSPYGSRDEAWENKPQPLLLELQSTLKMEMKELLWLLNTSFELASCTCASKGTQKNTWYTVGSCLFYAHSERRMQKSIKKSFRKALHIQLTLESKKFIHLHPSDFLLCQGLVGIKL